MLSVTEDRKHYLLFHTSKRKMLVEGGIIGLDAWDPHWTFAGNGTILPGRPSPENPGGDFTHEEEEELARYMIAQWKQFGGLPLTAEDAAAMLGEELP